MLTRVKPHMLEPLPAEIIPELLQARGTFNTLDERIKNINLVNGLGYTPINKAGDIVTGPISFAGGLIVVDDQTLQVDGTANFSNQISQVSSIDTRGHFGVSTVVADIHEYELTTTNMENVVSFQPKSIGNFLIYVYFRIKNVQSIMTLEIEYYDAGGIQHQRVIDSVVHDPGSYSLPSFFINALDLSPIYIKASSNISNQIFISANIIGL